MAVNTETKRRSALGMIIMALTIAPVPDGTIAAVDREHILGIYAGIAPALPGVLTSNIHIFSDAVIEPSYASDNSGSLLIQDDLEVQGGFFPRVLEQDDEPTAGTGATQVDSGELLVWIDTNDADKSYLVYNYGGTVTTILLT